MSFGNNNSIDIPLGAAIPLGFLNGWRNQHKFATKLDVSTSLVDIWTHSSSLIYLSSAETMNIASSSVNDTNSSGSGARTIRLFGLDNSYNEIQEDVILNGNSNVPTTNSYLRVYRMYVLTAGNTGANEGDITATSSSSSTVQAIISTGYNQTLQSQYTVPSGYYALVSNLIMSTRISDAARIQAETREFGGVFRPQRIFNIYQETFQDIFNPYFLIPPKTDMRIRAIKTGGSETVEVNVAYTIYLVDQSLAPIA